MFATLLGLNKIKAVFYIVIVVVIVGLIGHFWMKYNDAIKTITTIEEEKVRLEKANAVLVKSNDENQVFIKDMQKDIETKEKIVNDFRIQKARDNKKMEDLANIISKYPPTDDGPVAKTLKDTLIGIQKDREERFK